MSRSGGRRVRAIEGLAAALQECFDASIEAAEKRFEPRFDRQDETLRRQNETLRRQNETLRMIWTQCGGKSDQRLPVDD
ncbi:MAG: hypothetical protein OXU81_22990 [Gammaproteobacteria bacterium]|nr:hypothetical protein [Gammaproteobacteria bacterium]